MSRGIDMSDDKDTGKGLFKASWHRTPTAMIDLIMGASISPSAGWIVMTVIRYTQGMGGKKSATIPTGTFQRVLGVKKRQTVYSFVDEAISSGLINANKKRGCVTTYSINESCDLWHKEVVPQNGTSTDKGNTSSTDKGNTVVPQNGTPVVADKGTHIKKDIYKDSFKEQEEFDLFNDRYESIKIMLKQSGIIPIAKPINDEWLKPEVYRFNLWFTGKGFDRNFLMQQAATWFNKKTIEERRAYYTFPDEVKRNYYNPNDYVKSEKVSDEAAAAIKAKYMGALGM